MNDEHPTHARLEQAWFAPVGDGWRPKMPSRETLDAAALDVRSAEDVTLAPGECKLIGTGWAMRPPHGYAGFLLPRSGSGHKGLVLGNLVGLIDPDYTGELKVSLWNRTTDAQNPENHFTISKGDRIAQLIFLPYSRCTAVEVEQLPRTGRAEGGFGSTGDK